MEARQSAHHALPPVPTQPHPLPTAGWTRARPPTHCLPVPKVSGFPPSTSSLPIAQCEAFIVAHGLSAEGCVEKEELLARATQAIYAWGADTPSPCYPTPDPCYPNPSWVCNSLNSYSHPGRLCQPRLNTPYMPSTCTLHPQHRVHPAAPRHITMAMKHPSSPSCPL